MQQTLPHHHTIIYDIIIRLISSLVVRIFFVNIALMKVSYVTTTIKVTQSFNILNNLNTFSIVKGCGDCKLGYCTVFFFSSKMIVIVLHLDLNEEKRVLT